MYVLVFLVLFVNLCGLWWRRPRYRELKTLEPCSVLGETRADGTTCVSSLYYLYHGKRMVAAPGTAIRVPAGHFDKVVTPTPKPMPHRYLLENFSVETEKTVALSRGDPCACDVFTSEPFLSDEAKKAIVDGSEQCVSLSPKVMHVTFTTDTLFNNNGRAPNALAKISSRPPTYTVLLWVRDKFVEGFYFEGVSLVGRDYIYWSPRPPPEERYGTYKVVQLVDMFSEDLTALPVLASELHQVPRKSQYDYLARRERDKIISPLVWDGKRLWPTAPQFNVFKITPGLIEALKSNEALESVASCYSVK